MSYDFLQHLPWAALPLYLRALYGVFALSAVVQLGYYWWPFGRVAFSASRKGKGGKRPVSVVICAKNEQQELEKNLPLFLEQDYPEFEVVVVNDCSTDETEALLYALKGRYKHLQVTTIEHDRKFVHDRKLAITIGIKAARHSCIVFSEPGCTPPNRRWLEAMQQSFGDKGELVVGYCRSKRRRGLADKLMRADAVTAALRSLRGAMVGKPYRATFKCMGVSQQLFFRSKGFARFNAYPGSEETLFLCRNGSKRNTRVALHPSAIISSSQQLTLGQWFKQKCLHASLLSMGGRGAGRLRAETLSRLTLYATSVALAAMCPAEKDALLLWGVAPLLLLRFATRAVVMSRLLSTLQEKGLLLWVLLYDWVSPLVAFIVSMAQPNLQKIKKIK